MRTLFLVLCVAQAAAGKGRWTPEATASFARDLKSFGESVSIYGKNLIIGAPESQKALIFTQDSSGYWADKAEAVLQDPKDLTDVDQKGDPIKSNFGWDVAIAQDWNAAKETKTIMAVVGSPKKRKVYIFSRKTDNSWSLEGRIEQPDTEGFGHSVALTGDGGVVVGAPGAGKAFLYLREQGWRKPAGVFSGEPGFGHAVGAHKSQAIVGSPNERRAYIFESKDQKWSDSPSLIFEQANQLGYGYTTKIAGNYAIVGAPYAMKAYVYERKGGSDDGKEWALEPAAEFEYPEESGFGHAVGISESGRAIVTSHTSRKAHSFGRSNAGIWLQDQVIDAYSNSDGAFGMATGLHDRRLVVSAYPTRRVYVFEYLGKGESVARGRAPSDDEEEADGFMNIPMTLVLCGVAFLLFLRRRELWLCYLRRLANHRNKREAVRRNDTLIRKPGDPGAPMAETEMS